MIKYELGMVWGIALLLGGCQLADLQLSPLSLQQLPTPVAVSPNFPSPTTLEQSIHQQVNQYRQSRQLPPLKLDPRISQQARIHSQQMAAGTVPFSHQGFSGRVQTVGQQIPYRRVAENVAYNQGFAEPATEAVRGWIESTHHRQNMEGQFKLTGVGVAKNAAGEYYFTQIFLLQR